jgi:hypothetical protein
LRRLGRDERPDARRRTRPRFTIARIPIIGKNLSAAMSRKRPRGERGVACANAEADRRDAGARATSAKRAVEGRGSSDRESLAPTAGREIRQSGYALHTFGPRGSRFSCLASSRRMMRRYGAGSTAAAC